MLTRRAAILDCQVWVAKVRLSFRPKGLTSERILKRHCRMRTPNILLRCYNKKLYTIMHLHWATIASCFLDLKRRLPALNLTVHSLSKDVRVNSRCNGRLFSLDKTATSILDETMSSGERRQPRLTINPFITSSDIISSQTCRVRFTVRQQFVS